jgi:hypothetical protein
MKLSPILGEHRPSAAAHSCRITLILEGLPLARESVTCGRCPSQHATSPALVGLLTSELERARPSHRVRLRSELRQWPSRLGKPPHTRSQRRGHPGIAPEFPVRRSRQILRPTTNARIQPTQFNTLATPVQDALASWPLAMWKELSSHVPTLRSPGVREVAREADAPMAGAS